MATRVRGETGGLPTEIWNKMTHELHFSRRKEATLALAKCASRQRSIDEAWCSSRASRVWPPRHQRLG